eukprot:3596353-Prymnesium_polylepis.1
MSQAVNAVRRIWSTVVVPSSAVSEVSVQCCRTCASHATRPQVAKLVCACTDNATSSIAVLAAAAKDERTSIDSVSPYGAARSRRPDADRMSGRITSVSPSRIA